MSATTVKISPSNLLNTTLQKTETAEKKNQSESDLIKVQGSFN